MRPHQYKRIKIPHHMQPLRYALDQNWKSAILTDFDNLVKLRADSVIDDPEKYKDVCMVSHLSHPITKYKGLDGYLIINAPYKKVVATVTECLQCDESSPEQLKAATIMQQVTFFSETDEQNYRSTINQTNQQDFTVSVYSVSRSPAPIIVHHRDFVSVTQAKFSEGKCVMITRSVTNQDVQKGCVRGLLINVMFTVERVSDQVTKVSQFILCDPMGSIPGAIYAATLNSRMYLLIALKDHLEGRSLFVRGAK